MKDLYYKPSGKFNPISFLYIILGCIIAAPILAAIYAYAIRYIPFIYINFLILAGFAIGLGFAANLIVGLGKVRNKVLGAIFGLVMALAGLYAAWGIWIASFMDDVGMIEVLKNPTGIKNMIGLINEQGTWGFRSGGNVDGTMLTIVWVIETLAIVIVPIFFGYTKAGEPFIENEDDWAEETPIGPFEVIQNGGELVRDLEASNYESLLAIQVSENGGEASHSILSLFHGKERNQAKEFYLSVSNMIEKYDKDGKLDFDENYIVQNIKISKEAGQQLLAKTTGEQ